MIIYTAIFRVFAAHRDKFVLLWREHPLTMETLHSMHPELLVSYLKLKKEFEEWELGILDENEEPHLAMAVSDCYFGAGGSLVTIYSVTGKTNDAHSLPLSGRIAGKRDNKGRILWLPGAQAVL